MGLDEVLDDQSFGFGTHNLKIGPGGLKSARWRRQKSLALFKPLLKLYSSPNDQLSNDFQTGLVEPLANDINILTLEKWSENEILVRLENLNEISDVIVKPDVINILQPRTFKKCQVVNLIGQPHSELFCQICFIFTFCYVFFTFFLIVQNISASVDLQIMKI